MRHLHVRIVVGVLISLLIFMTSTVFANNNNADTEPSVITGKASNRTTLTDENSPMETQNAQCTIKAGNIEASAQASVSKRLEGICGTNQMKMSFEIIEARLIHEINQLKAMIYALLPNQPMNYQPNAFSYSPPYNKPVYHQSTYPTYANSYEDTTKQTTSYTTQTNIPPLQPTTTSNPFKLTTPTDKPVVEKRTTIARTTRTTTESLNVVNTQKPDTKSSTVSSATEKILEFRPVQTKSLNRFRSKHHKPGPRDFEVHKFNNTLLSGGEIRIFTYYWRFENFTSILKSNASFIYSPIFSISGKCDLPSYIY